MNHNQYAMTPAELIISKCAQLYAQYGYRRFTMNKFEDYALYAENKNFLVDDRLLTFTDGSKLKALKPDITLSIVKSLAANPKLPLKAFYNETVYRVKKGEKEFSELHQMGLELIGDGSIYATSEVLGLAKTSLDAIDTQNILDISHMGILMPLIDKACECGVDREELIALITQKNADGIAAVLGAQHPLTVLVNSYAPIGQMIPVLQDMLPDLPAVCELAEIADVLHAMELDAGVYLDFSLMHDFGYYNGIIFKGYIKEVPVAVLSGGRYDPLLDRFGMSTAALGFAIYLDYIHHTELKRDTDALLIYSEADKPADVARAVKLLTKQGYLVLAAQDKPENRSFIKVFDIKEVLA